MPLPAQISVEQVLDAGRAAYPEIQISDEIIVSALAGRELEPRYPADLFLATVALTGDSAALRVIDRLLVEVRPALRGVVLDHDVDELVQELRVRLVVGSVTKGATLGSYTGKGPLRAWLRVALLRAGLDRRRKPQDALLDETEWLAIPSDEPDPALAALRRTAAPAVRTALELAVAHLDSRDRLILRQHLIDGLAPPELATLYRVHRVTAFRWLATIKRRVLEDVRAQLARELGIADTALDSLMRRMRDSVAPTVERILLATPDPT
jgi:RNA polymerase sigma-70 factor (ECF subfamily)